jgi:hypothetical protein
LRPPFFCKLRRGREHPNTQSASNLDEAKDSGSNNYDYETCKDNNPNNASIAARACSGTCAIDGDAATVTSSKVTEMTLSAFVWISGE